MIKALIFDCFGVFYIDPVFARMHNPQTPTEEADTLHKLDEQAAKGKINKSQFEQEAATLLHENPEDIEHEFFEGKARNQILLDLAQSLRAQYKIALLSNIGVDMMDGFFTPSERKGLFDVVTLSGEVGYAKPDPEIFKLTCAKLSVEPNEAIMIDDVESNINAAKQLGMQGIHYENFTQFKTSLDVILSENLG